MQGEIITVFEHIIFTFISIDEREREQEGKEERIMLELFTSDIYGQF